MSSCDALRITRGVGRGVGTVVGTARENGVEVGTTVGRGVGVGSVAVGGAGIAGEAVGVGGTSVAGVGPQAAAMHRAAIGGANVMRSASEPNTAARSSQPSCSTTPSSRAAVPPIIIDICSSPSPAQSANGTSIHFRDCR